jgi:hypothetical protein
MFRENMLRQITSMCAAASDKSESCRQHVLLHVSAVCRPPCADSSASSPATPCALRALTRCRVSRSRVPNGARCAGDSVTLCSKIGIPVLCQLRR